MYCLIYYIMTILTPILSSPDFFYLSLQGQVSQEGLATSIQVRIVQGILLMVEGKDVNLCIQRGIQEYRCQLSEGWQ